MQLSDEQLDELAGKIFASIEREDRFVRWLGVLAGLVSGFALGYFVRMILQ